MSRRRGPLGILLGVPDPGCVEIDRTEQKGSRAFVTSVLSFSFPALSLALGLLGVLTLATACAGPSENPAREPVGTAVPLSSSGVPLRGVEVGAEWGTHLGNNERTGSRLLPAITEPTLAWQATVGIAGYANSPLVDATRVYVPSQGLLHDRDDAEDGIFALDRETGAELWFWHARDDINGASLAPDSIIACSDDGTVAAVSRADGHLLWTWTAQNSVHHGPLVVDDLAVVHADGALIFLALSTGQLAHTVDLPEDDYMAGRGGVALAGETIVVMYPDGGVAGVAGGQLVWQHGGQSMRPNEWQPPTQPYATPLVVGDLVVTLQQTYWSWDDTELILRVIDAQTGVIRWEDEISAAGSSDGMVLPSGVSMPAFDASNGLPYLAATPWVMNGVLHLLLPVSPVIRRFSLDSGNALPSFPLQTCNTLRFASIVGTPSRMYIVMHDNRLVALSVANGGVDWVLNTAQETTFSDGANIDIWSLFRERYVYCEPYPTDGNALFATPAMDEQGSIYVATGDGRLLKIRDAAGAHISFDE
jgi:outer membrane protein assembly factor BamB